MTNIEDKRHPICRVHNQPRYLGGPCKLVEGPAIAWHFLLNFRWAQNILGRPGPPYPPDYGSAIGATSQEKRSAL